MFFSPVSRFLGITTVRRFRILPVPGKVVVRKGQKVNGNDVIAEAKLAPEHLLLDIGRGLGLSPGKADAHISRQVGEEVSEGDVIAGPVGFARRVVRAPSSGRIVLAGSGQVLIELDSRPFELKAGLPGVVSELINERGAVIEATGALLQGVWGNGRIDSGLLQVVARSPQDTLSKDRLDVSQRGAVIVGGHCSDADALTAAEEIPLKGLILASMDGKLLSTAEKLRCPVVLIEGFGKIPMNPAAYKLLTTNERREIAVNAEPWDRLAGIRPELVIPLPAAGNIPILPEQDMFAPGKQVRIVSASQKGMTGTVVSLRPGLTQLPSGVKAYTAEVRFTGGESAVIPLANLEILE
jgi:hypothetical protein